jgi:hypothetical protein
MIQHTLVSTVPKRRKKGWLMSYYWIPGSSYFLCILAYVG